MGHLNLPYYVSLLSGAEYYGASHQKPAVFQVITNRQLKNPIVCGDVGIQIVYKKELKNLPARDFVVNTGKLKLGSPELVAYDLISFRV